MSARSLGGLGEFGLIDRLAAGLKDVGPEVRLGIGDDAAVLAVPPEHELVTTIDALVEDVHFRRVWSRPEDIGWKLLAVNVSDLCAMGARPLAAVVTLALPAETPVRWVELLYRGLREAADRYRCPVVGGDTVRGPERITLSLAAVGTVPVGKAVTRAGAGVGDWLCVTGVLGESAAGLGLLEQGKRGFADLVRRHRRPEPPIEAGAVLAEQGLATAMLDLSDGLAGDAGHLARRSGCGVQIEPERLPISDLTRRAARGLGVDPTDWAVHGGEDYELLFAVPPTRWHEVPPALASLGVVATRIGTLTARPGVRLLDPDGRTRPLKPLGFAHFSKAGD